MFSDPNPRFYRFNSHLPSSTKAHWLDLVRFGLYRDPHFRVVSITNFLTSTKLIFFCSQIRQEMVSRRPVRPAGSAYLGDLAGVRQAH